MRGIPLFRFRNIPVTLHWSWLLVAGIEVWWRSGSYGHWAWNLAEYVVLFVIVLMHEFGHALACQSVGGTVEGILLWPLGGVARVQPPQQPGAQLWSIAAGPLVNVALLPVTIGLVFAGGSMGLGDDAQHFVTAIAFINALLLGFNLLPVFPLDGGQILRSLLWYPLGRERSLAIAAGLGLVVSTVGGVAVVLVMQDLWLGLIAAYAAWHSWRALKSARARMGLAKLPRHPRARCPSCGEAPPAGPFVRCPNAHVFSPYDGPVAGACPTCGFEVTGVPCLFCGETHRPQAAVDQPPAVLDAVLARD